MEDILDPELLPWLIELRLVGLADIKEGADRQIAQDEKPAGMLIDLSLSKNLDEVLRCVRPDLTTRPTERVKAEILSRLREAVVTDSLDLGEAVSRYHGFAVKNLDTSDDIWASAIYIEDGYELALQGIWGNVDDVRQEFLADLARLQADLEGER